MQNKVGLLSANNEQAVCHKWESQWHQYRNKLATDPSVLKTLPLYQKKSTMCDALCHAIESYWSVNSTEESKSYSEIAIKEILKNADGYLSNTMSGNSGMLFAAHQAGKAINITQTTAGHAMCYKITSLYGISHGHAAILCDRILFPWMINNIELCVDLRGQEYLEKTLCDLGVFLGGSDSVSGAAKLELFFKSLNFDIPIADDYQINELNHSVNPVRLKNHPILLDEESINFLYHNILRCKYES